MLLTESIDFDEWIIHILLNSHKFSAYFCANYPGSTVQVGIYP